MKKIFLSLAFLLIISNSAQAQTHPCDTPAQVNPSLTSPVKVGFCFDNKNVDGSVATPSNFKVYAGTATTAIWSGSLQPIGAANGAGQFYYETPSITLNTGTHSLKVSVTTVAGGEGVASAPFTVSITANPKPGSPSIIRIVK